MLGRALVTALLVILAAVGLLLFLRIIFLFFSSLQTIAGYQLVLDLTNFCVEPLTGLEQAKTPYGGIFDLPALICLIVVTVVESFLAALRNALGRRI